MLFYEEKLQSLERKGAKWIWSRAIELQKAIMQQISSFRRKIYYKELKVTSCQSLNVQISSAILIWLTIFQTLDLIQSYISLLIALMCGINTCMVQLNFYFAIYFFEIAFLLHKTALDPKLWNLSVYTNYTLTKIFLSSKEISSKLVFSKRGKIW